MIESFLKTLTNYASAYKELETIQENKKFYFVPTHGDQKTGLIGESFLYLYLERTDLYSSLAYGLTTQNGWDLKATKKDGSEEHIQIKTTSAFSNTRRISPIHKGWDKLYLISLSESFTPDAVWLFEDTLHIDTVCSKTCTMRTPGKTDGTRVLFENSIDITEKFKKYFPEIYT
jgi:hypothetical protein